MSRRKPKPLSATQQLIELRRAFPGGRVSLGPGRLEWEGVVQPTPASRSYRIRLSYSQGLLPKVRVLDDLSARPGESLPHVFRDGTLCLNEAHDWDGGMFLARTTLPWACEWLANYEIWLATGKWYGGGVWPPRRRSPGKRGESHSPAASASASQLTVRRPV